MKMNLPGGPLSEDDLVAFIRPFVDASYYLGKYTDVRDAKFDPVLHYVRHGAAEGRDPNAWFSTSLYRRLHKGLAPTVNPLYDHLTNGGRPGDRLQANAPPIADPLLNADKQALMAMIRAQTLQSFDAQSWDYTITSFEPLQKVTGGIGTYTRLLLPYVAEIAKTTLVLVRGDAELQGGTTLGNVHFVNVSGFSDRFGEHTFVGDEHDMFALDVFYFLAALCRTGHAINVVEFSDYGVDGYFAFKGQEAGVIQWAAAHVRLHSPEVMLFEDNAIPPASLTTFRRNRIDRELYCFKQADSLLFGGAAMRDRIASLCLAYGLDVTAKMKWAPHPWNADLFGDQEALPKKQALARKLLKLILHNVDPEYEVDGRKFVGFIGRIEDRKGQYQFVDWVISDRDLVEVIKAEEIHFLFFGRNVLDDIGNLKLDDLYQRLWDLGLRDHFVFFGNLDQELLNVVSFAMDGFIFPSIFENYPNALLEVLPACKPLLISERGCMVEMTNDMSNVISFDPRNMSAEPVRKFLSAISLNESAKTRTTELSKRREVAERNNEKLGAEYSALLKRKSKARVKPVRNAPLSPISFVVPIFEDFQFLEEALASLKRCARRGDEIIVCDDGSSAQSSNAIELICTQHDVRLVRLPRNEGPNAARLLGVQTSVNPIIQFCDGDDLLEPQGIALARAYLSKSNEISCVFGLMRCFGDEDHVWVPRDGHLWTACEENYSHSGLMIRKEVALDVLGTERRPILEDWETNLNLVFSGYAARMLPVVTYNYRRQGVTRSIRGEAQYNRVRNDVVVSAARRMSQLPASEMKRLSEHYRTLLSKG